MTDRPKVFMARPTYTRWSIGGRAFYSACSNGDDLDVVCQMEYGTSALGKVFNMLWATAIGRMEQGVVTHFAMLHADILPEDYWLDTLMDELIANDADVMSAVAPIKDSKGLSSVAIDDPQDPYQCLRRFTMRELEDMPETFDHVGAGYPNNIMMVNTGCWVCDLRKPWVTAADADGALKVFFTIQDTIRRSRNPKTPGQLEVGMNPEDWEFSRRVHRMGGKLFATRKVRLQHFGEQGYPNYGGWGKYEHDEDTAWKWKHDAATQAKT